MVARFPQYSADCTRLSRYCFRHRRASPFREMIGHSSAQEHGRWWDACLILLVPVPRLHASNFSNEGGIGGKINFLKIVNGMWMLQQCMAAWKTKGSAWTMEKLLEECSTLSAPTFLINVDDPDLLLPGNMPGRINTQLKRANQPTIEAEPAIANLIFYSLAARYAEVLRDLENVTGKKLQTPLHSWRWKQEHIS